MKFENEELKKNIDVFQNHWRVFQLEIEMMNNFYVNEIDNLRNCLDNAENDLKQRVYEYQRKSSLLDDYYTYAVKVLDSLKNQEIRANIAENLEDFLKRNPI